MNNVNLFGKSIAIKAKGCNQDNYRGKEIPPSVNVFVKVTSLCNAHCLFCSNFEASPIVEFDINKLFGIIDEIKKIGLKINRINITGGEPSLAPDIVENILLRIDNVAYQDIHLHLNTNGLTSASQQLMKNSRWDSISISIHHYDIRKLSDIFNSDIQSRFLVFEGVKKEKVNVSCNLIRGYIDTTDECHKMMDFCMERGFFRLGFVGLMKVNDYCREHFVSPNELHLDDISHCYYTESKNRNEDCCCSNYIYNKNLKILDVYMRHYANFHYCESSLMYDGRFLRQGFQEQNIIY